MSFSRLPSGQHTIITYRLQASRGKEIGRTGYAEGANRPQVERFQGDDLQVFGVKV